MINDKSLRLFLVSFLLLFAEVMCIRWFSMEFTIVRVLPNLVLLIAFVGASLGLSKSEKFDSWLKILIGCLMLGIPLTLSTPLHLYALTWRLDQPLPGLLASSAILLILVAGLLISFINIGKLLGREFSQLPPLRAYSINLLGSIAGVLLFALISWLAIPPAIWLLVIAISIAVLLPINYRNYAYGLGICLAIAAFMSNPSSVWSAYGKIDLIPLDMGPRSIMGPGNYILNCNNDLFHLGLHCLKPEDEKVLLEESKTSAPTKYLLQYYRWLKIPILASNMRDEVLVLGGGSGNDVSFALANGAKHVDVVDINQKIADLGMNRHPDRPYRDPRVTLFVEDARTYLRTTQKKYDFIEFAFLDQGATIHSAAFLRIDNYVYTVESIKAALKHLKPTGIISLNFAVDPSSPIIKRLYQTITKAIGHPPLSYAEKDANGAVFFLFGNDLKPLDPARLALANWKVWPDPGTPLASKPATDDWPFLYLEFDRGGFMLYLAILFAAVVLPAVEVLRGHRKFISPAAWGNMFFLGQGFMLLETKAITKLSLLLGATWIVSSVVILVILTLAWLSNLLVQRYPLKRVWPMYACLGIALALDYFWTVPDHTTLPAGIIVLISAFLACLPVFFSGFIFSSCLKSAEAPAMYLSANTLGVAIGGLTENLSIFTGIRSLSIIAFVLYGLSFLSLLVRKQSKPGDK